MFANAKESESLSQSKNLQAWKINGLAIRGRREVRDLGRKATHGTSEERKSTVAQWGFYDPNMQAEECRVSKLKEGLNSETLICRRNLKTSKRL
jgi:hypothetical protein